MLGCAAGACLLLLGLCSSAASADDSLSSTAVKSVLAVCPNQTFSQPFIELGDANYYMQVSGPQGWDLRGGAQVVQTTLPNGSSGAAVDLPSGSVAIVMSRLAIDRVAAEARLAAAGGRVSGALQTVKE